MGTPREQLAELLKKARLDAGFESHNALAKRLAVSRSVVTKAENSTQPIPSEALLVAWAGATGASLDKLTDLARRCRSGTPEWFMPYRQAEGEATTIRSWAPLIHPGLVQTEAYAFEVLAVEPSTAGRLNDLVAARMERQQVLQRVYLTVAIYAPVMYHLIGSPAVMTEQSGHLLDLAQRPNISLHIVPEGSNTGVWGAIDIASHDGADTVCLTTGLNDVTTTSTEVADQAMRAFDRILGAAMPTGESLDFVRAAEGHWKEQT